ncbi:ABC transporter permease subunit [Vibrio sp.]|nr:ABC transporter permease subunit [Vibrio sp.]
MLLYILRRLNLFLITLVLLTFIGYSLIRLDPSVPLSSAPFFTGWLSYLIDIYNLDFGTDKHGIPIIQQLSRVFPATLELCIIAFCIALIIGLPFGTIAGMKRGKSTDTFISLVSVIGYSTPIFWIALLLIYLFSLHWQILPVSGRYALLYEIPPITGFAVIDVFLSEHEYKNDILNSILSHLILPSLVLAMVPTTQVISLMRTAVVDVMEQNYIRVAKIRGLSAFDIVFQHVLRNALPPIIPKLGVQFSTMLTLVIVTESVFDWPGVGRWLLDALAKQDYVAIQAGVLVVAGLVLTVNILSELLGVLTSPLLRKEWYVDK